MKTSRIKQLSRLLLLLLFPLILASCNLGGNPEQQLDVTEVPTNSANPTRTPLSNNNFPTSQAATQIPIPTSSVNFSTSVAVLPPTFTPLPVSIAILSPIPGNVVAGNLQVLGAASHPLFLQYQVEFGPDPNPNNLWFPITGVVQAPVTTNGLLGIWNTMTTQDGIYQLRLRVFLRDGTDLSTVVNNIRIQNQAPTPVPTSTQTIPRPIAAFTQDLTTGNAPLVVRFINQSNGAIDSYTWNFGDRSTSAEINPSHTFTTPGVYTVTLTVTGPGGSSNVSRVINVQSTTAPVAAFTQDRTSGPSPLAVQFTNQSTGNITAYEWNFGDGQTSNAVSPAHTFVDVGTYNVILRVLGPGGSSTVTRQITVQNPQIPAPDAVFTPNTTITGNTPLQVQFENASTGDITGYTWNFGDNTPTSNQESPLHTFTTAGTYTVQLTVVGPGGQDTAQVVVEAVQPPDAPVASFTINGLSSDRIPMTVTFNNTTSGEVDDYLWDFGDGTTSDSTESLITHEYTAAGTYTIKLTASNESGSTEFTETITALPPLVEPDALFTANPTSGPAPLTVEFQNQSAGDNLSFEWNFGDGSPLSTTDQAILTHEYTQQGTYTVQLTASNPDEGLSDSFQLDITVSEEVSQVDPIQANFTAAESSPLVVDFSATASGGDSNYTYEWDFGDGNIGTGQLTQHTYATEGDYTVTLTISDSASTTPAVSTQIITVSPPPVTLDPLQISFTTTESSPLTVDFNATISGGDGNYTVAWDFGDGNVGNGITTQHPYAAGGTYTVNVTVTDTANSTPATASQQVTVTEALAPLQISFTATESSPLTVDFNATISGGDGNYTVAWDFGDGNVGNGATTQHTYAAGGTYTVNVTVTDTANSTPATASQQVTVTEALAPLQISFTATESTPLVVDFSASATGGDGNYTIAWDFGDGNVGNGATTQHTYDDGDTYTVNVTVTDTANSTPATASQQVTVTEPVVLDPIQVNFTATELSPLLGDFSASATGGDGNYSYAWDFGDGNVGNGATTQHTYGAGGTYTVNLTVTDTANSTPATSSQQITVTEPVVLDPLQISFTATESTPLVVDFSATPSGGDGNYTVAWDFGDGNVGNGATTQHTYAAGGTYTVNVTVTDTANSTPATSSQQVTVTEPVVLDPLQISFTATESSPLVVDFSAMPSGGDGNYTVAWDFGDGNIGNGATTQHTYAAGGTYTVNVTVTDTANSTPATASQQVTVTEPVTLDPLQINFTATESSPLVVDFSASATGGDGIYTVAWDFGDGNIGNGATTQHTYTAGGTYTVNVTVTDTANSTPATSSQQVTVTEASTPSIVETSPIVPDMNNFMSNLIRVYQGGIAQGRNADAFALIGDQTAVNPQYLDPFDDTDPSTFALEPGTSDFLQNVINAYNTDMADATSSFSRSSVATGDLLIADLQRPGSDFSPICSEPGETLLACELRIANASVAIINIGYRDALEGTDPAAFEANLQQVINTILGSNVIPVVNTIYPRLGDQGIIDRTLTLNEAIFNTANALGMPVFNQWRVFNELANSGLNGDNVSPSVAPEGAGSLAGSGLQYGANARNFYTLALLENLRTSIFR